ncbi:MAG: AraC family transcriptional regulator [Gelidibacter sp.]
MRHSFASPSAALKSYIDYYFVFENKTDNPSAIVDVFPTPGTSMVFSFGNKDIHEYTHQGKNQKPSYEFAVDTYVLKKRKFIGRNNFGILVVCFKPWAIHNFIPFHIKEVPGQRIELKDLYPNKMQQLEEKLHHAKADSERIFIIESFLLAILKEKPISQKMLKACSMIKKSVGMMTVCDIAKKVDLSEKQFHRNFTESTGISPKLYSRLERFYFAVTKMKQAQTSLTDIALDSGYFDQAHFIHEFKNFAHITPKEYQKNEKNAFFGHPLNS